MAKLPVIVGFGGMNSAGRSSGFHSYKRMVADSLSDKQMYSTWQDLTNRMKLGDVNEQSIQAAKDGTLVRKVETFDPDNILYQHAAKLEFGEQDVTFELSKRKLPKQVPDNWVVEDISKMKVKVTISGELNALLPDRTTFPVSSAGNIPTNFDPAELYNARFHPRGLQLSVYGASDAINSLGFDWTEVMKHIKPDEVSVYAGSALAQIDDNSLSGMVAAPLIGSRVSTKMMALSLAEMPADFINGYMINGVGTTGTNMGACATFLYNVRQGLYDIQQGKSKVAIVGNAEAPVVAELMEGFRVMGALAQDEELMKLDGSDTPNNRKACRPFSENCGFTMAESSQFLILMDDELALKMGANIYGSVADVFINADGNKKSISAPGVGNYVTVAKATALAKAILGEEDLQKTYVQAHGTGTPQNRVTESHILNEVADTFGIKDWKVTAIKSYVGHSMGPAAGDQIMASLGVWQYGVIPGIKTIDHIADDVHQDHLNILMQDAQVGEKGEDIKGVILNSKGFGGNNASGLLLSPTKTLEMLSKRHGEAALAQWQSDNVAVASKAANTDQQACAGNEKMIYEFGTSVMDENDVELSQGQIKLSEYASAIDLPSENPFSEYS